MKQRSVHLMNENCSTTRVYLFLESSSRSRSKMSALAEMLTWQGKKTNKLLVLSVWSYIQLQATMSYCLEGWRQILKVSAL